MANQNRDIQPARDARPRGTDPNTPHETMHKRIREYEHTCPVCGQTHPHSKPKLEAEVVKVRAKLECACLPAGKHTVKRVSALRIKTLSKGGNKPRGGGVREGVHLSSLRTDTPRNHKIQQSETNREKREPKRVYYEPISRGGGN